MVILEVLHFGSGNQENETILDELTEKLCSFIHGVIAVT